MKDLKCTLFYSQIFFVWTLTTLFKEFEKTIVNLHVKETRNRAQVDLQVCCGWLHVLPDSRFACDNVIYRFERCTFVVGEPQTIAAHKRRKKFNWWVKSCPKETGMNYSKRYRQSIIWKAKRTRNNQKIKKVSSRHIRHALTILLNMDYGYATHRWITMDRVSILRRIFNAGLKTSRITRMARTIALDEISNLWKFWVLPIKFSILWEPPHRRLRTCRCNQPTALINCSIS